jgi:uncharacterized HAD superfamily protein
VKIGVDVDDTTLAFCDHWVELYQLWFDRYVDPAALTHWEALVTETHFADKRAFFEWFARARGWETMPYVPGAPGGLDRLVAAGHELVFGTARSRDADRPTLAWWRSSPWAHHSTLRTNLQRKSLTNCDVYIDDSPAVIEELVRTGKSVIIFDRPWNQDAEIAFSVAYGAPPVVRAHDWHEVTNHVQNIVNWEKELLS